MNNPGPPSGGSAQAPALPLQLQTCRRFLKRHAEALFIIGFIAADCFLSGTALTVGSIIIVAYALAPAIASLPKLDPAGRIVYLKAWVKTRTVQRTAVILVWLYSIRYLIGVAMATNLYGSTSNTSLSTALYIAARDYGPPLGFLFSPVIIYMFACFAAIVFRSRLKATKQDSDLIQQRQTWVRIVQPLFALAFVGGIFSITANPNGPAMWVSNWLLASARDANLYAEGTMDFIWPFDVFVIGSISTAALVYLIQPAMRLNALLTSFCWRVVSPTSLQNMIEGMLEALRLPTRILSLRESHPLAKNALRTLIWVVTCYAVLLWIFGFCPGPIGDAIQNWMMASALDAGFGTSFQPHKFIYTPEFRIFMGAVVALYGTAPIAITAATFLPFAKPRQVQLTADGLLFAQGPYLSLHFQQFRLWSDLKAMKLTRRKQFKLEFRSGGSVTFDASQMPAPDVKVLLASIDQYAIACTVEPEAIAYCLQLMELEPETAASDGIAHAAIAQPVTEEFKSTVFVPYTSGEFIGDSKLRIIKQLASKPLCAVYLARDENGRMVIVKQFYLADETVETKALQKVLKREYDLLAGLDHPGIAKVINCFTVDKSTYLVIENRVGSDLRQVVAEHGSRSESLTLAWAKQLCEIMIYLHSHEPPILHRDLTPDNVIAGEDGQLRLIDFGAAREYLDGITGTMIGKHCYVPPEQLRGQASTRSDIYTFGCTLYFLLTGTDPTALSQSSPAKCMDCSDEIDRLIRDCTEFDEDKRPQSFEEILRRLNDMNKGFWIKIPAAKETVVA